jgi:hypothetical protein
LTTWSDSNRSAAIALLVLTVALASCTSVGSGSPAPSSVRSGAPSPHAGRFDRALQHTPIGDLVRLDVCAAITGVRFDRLALAATVEEVQDPGSFDVTLHGRSGESFFVSVSLDTDDTTNGLGKVVGATKRFVAGLPVLRFNTKFGDGPCQQVIGRKRVDVDVYIQPAKDVATPRARTCQISDAIVNKIAGTTAHAAFPALELARQSLSDLDFCAIAGRTVDAVPIPGLRPALGDTAGVHCTPTTPGPAAGKSVRVDVSMALDTRTRIEHARQSRSELTPCWWLTTRDTAATRARTYRASTARPPAHTRNFR